MTNIKINWKFSLLLSIIFFVYTFPVLTNGSYYIDDLARSVYGNTDWSNNGRPLADILFKVINFGSPIIDLSPLPLIIGLLSIVISASVFYRRIFGDDYITASLCFSMIITSPFYIENLSYSFDSLTMCLSISTALIASNFAYQNSIKMVVISVIALVSSLCLYQASLNIYVIVILALVIGDIAKGKCIRLILIGSALSVLSTFISVTLYSKAISKFFVTGDYNNEHSKLLTINKHFIDSIIKNANGFYDFIKLLMSGANAFLYYSLVLLALASFIFVFIFILRADAQKTPKRIILASCFIAAFVFLIGPMVALDSPVFAPRVMLGVGGVMFLSSCIFYFSKAPIIIIRSYLSIFLFFSIVFSYGAFNAISSQYKFEQRLIERISIDSDIKELYGKFDSIKFVGVEPFSETNGLIVSKYPLMSILIPRHINNGWIWSWYLMKHNHFTENISLSDSQPVLIGDWVIKENPVYKLGLSERVLVVMFK